MAKEMGIYLESDYPYVAAKGPVCHEPQAAEYKIFVEGHYYYRDAQSVPEPHILDILREKPIAAGVHLYDSFTTFTGEGIYNGPTPEDLTRPVLNARGDAANYHAVLIIGFGEENGETYYLLKNSWGENWGYKGYCKIRRGILKKFATPRGTHYEAILKPEDCEYVNDYDKKSKGPSKDGKKGSSSKEVKKKGSSSKDPKKTSSGKK